jgi:predicted nucleic acid-binding protein
LTLIDTNILVDVLLSDEVWRTWSAQMLDQRAAQGPLLVSDVVYAELSSRFDSEKQLRSALADLDVAHRRIPLSALFAAGQAFQRYRRAGGPRLSILADFFIGAHAHAEGLPILTRDTRRYRTYFPGVELIAPSG